MDISAGLNFKQFGFIPSSCCVSSVFVIWWRKRTPSWPPAQPGCSSGSSCPWSAVRQRDGNDTMSTERHGLNDSKMLNERAGQTKVYLVFKNDAPGNSLTRACLRRSWTFQNRSGPRLRIQRGSVKNTIIVRLHVHSTVVSVGLNIRSLNDLKEASRADTGVHAPQRC